MKGGPRGGLAVPVSHSLLLLLLAAVSMMAPAAPAGAQPGSKLINSPAETYAVAPGGVDMRTGRYAYSQTDLSIGASAGTGGLALTRSRASGGQGHSNPFGGFSHNWDVMVVERRLDIEAQNPEASGPDYRMGVHFGGRSQTFQSYAPYAVYEQVSRGGPPAALTYTGTRDGAAIYTFTASDGTVAEFLPLGPSRTAFVSTITEVDGTKFSLDYTSEGRLRRVISSRGYALLLEGGSFVSKACVLNLAAAPLPATGLCPPDAPAATYGYTAAGELASVTSPGNSRSEFTYSTRASDGSPVMGFVKPGYASPWLTHVRGTGHDEEGVEWEVIREQEFHDGQRYAYQFHHPPPVQGRTAAVVGGLYTDASGMTTNVKYGFPIQPGSNRCSRPPCPPLTKGSVVYQQTSGPAEIRAPLGRTTYFDHCDPAENSGCLVGLLRAFTDPEGRKTELDYDGNRNVVLVRRHPKPGILDPDGTAPVPSESRAEYDLAHPKSASKPLSMTDANGNVTRWEYSPDHGGVLKETGAQVNGAKPQKRYAYAQRQARAADGSAAGPQVWLLVGMSQCRHGNPADPGPGCAAGSFDEVVTTYDYGADDGSPTNLLLRGESVAAVEGILRTCFAYDRLGRKISETGPNGTAHLAACPASPPTGPLPFTTGTRYDADGRVTGTIAPEPNGPGGGAPAVRNSYDPAGRLTVVEQGTLAAWQSEAVAPAHWPGFTVHKRIDTEYDSLDRKTREWVTGVGGTIAGITEYSYDLHGRLKCTAARMNRDVWTARLPDKCVPGSPHATDRFDRIAMNVYDGAGRLAEVWEGVGTPLQRREALYSYNLGDQRTSLTDARGFKAEMTWDGLGRQSRWIFPSKSLAGQAEPGDFEYYLYDAQGNRTALKKRDGSILRYQYDALNRMKAKIVPERPGLTPAQTRDVHYAYDNRGLQTGARFGSLDGEGVTTWYDGFGRPVTALLYMSGRARYLGYVYHGDSLFRISHPDGSGFAFHYDGLGRMTHLFDNPAGSSLYDNVIGYHYRQDGPRHAAVRGSGLAGFTTVYYPDFVQRPGSILNDLPGTADDMSIGLAYNPAGQIEQLNRHNDAYLWRGAAPVERDYAVNGQNQYISTGTAGLDYDANGNLAWDGSTAYVYDVENRLVSASGAKTATLAYDPLGRLWQTSGGAAGVTEFLHDGDKLVAEYNADGTLIRRYAHGPGTDEPVAVYEGPALGAGSSRRYMLPDERGSIVALINADGSPSVINTYDEYGVPGAEPQGRFGYTGQTWIPELGLWYYKARFYSSRLGRFLQEDPIGYEGGINLYAYVGNDPINGKDPTGTSCVEVKGKYVCKVDRIVLPKGQKALTKAQAIKLKEFESRYSEAVNKMYQNNRTVLVGPTSGRKGTSFRANSREIAKGLIKRTFIYQSSQSRGMAGMDSGKNYGGSWTNVWEGEMGRGENQKNDIAHEGIHRSPAEQFGNALGPVLGIEPYATGHQDSYNKAAADMLKPE